MAIDDDGVARPAGMFASALPGAAARSIAPTGDPTAIRAGRPAQSPWSRHRPGVGRRRVYAALDLGTNNCRLLVAEPTYHNFRVTDAFSRIVRLGEGLDASRRLGEAAIERAIEALKVCRAKMDARGVVRARLIATEACRAADNGEAFIARVHDEAGLRLEVVDRRSEAFLAVAGCATLADPDAKGLLLFDIGGGSTEIAWLDGPQVGACADPCDRIRSWASLPVGVVTLAERHGGVEVTQASYEAMVDEVSGLLAGFIESVGPVRGAPGFHLLGTSGTVTTIAGVHLDLPRYDRRRVDGLWLADADVTGVIERLMDMDLAERAASPCIGRERADLVLAGCAILDALRRAFPSPRLRIADRGLREGILLSLMREDDVWRGRLPS